MIDDAAKKAILTRRMRFVAAALASAGVVPACHEGDAPVVVVPLTTETATATARPVPAPTSSSLAEGPDDRVAVTPGLDVDSDGDGIPDALDACPTVPGTASSTPNYNGCPPMPCLSVVAPGLSARIRFRPASTAIEPGDQRYVTDIATFMTQYTYANATCVVSRAASEPAAIGAQRAAALKAALVAQKVDPSRITVQTTTSDGASATCVAR